MNRVTNSASLKVLEVLPDYEDDQFDNELTLEVAAAMCKQHVHNFFVMPPKEERD